jgi:hypothetical protein
MKKKFSLQAVTHRKPSEYLSAQHETCITKETMLGSSTALCNPLTSQWQRLYGLHRILTGRALYGRENKISWAGNC